MVSARYLLKHVEQIPDAGCWIWMGHVDKDGYGRRRDVGSVHRHFYKEFKGAIPAGFEVDHLCKVRCCLNPAHMEAISKLENNWRNRKPTCGKGHAMVGDNVRYFGNRRDCRACSRETWHRRKGK